MSVVFVVKKDRFYLRSAEAKENVECRVYYWQ
jgi:hypothetical protein